MEPRFKTLMQIYIEMFVTIAVGAFAILTIFEFMKILFECFLK